MTPLHEKYPEQAKKAFSNPDAYADLHRFLGLPWLYKIGIDHAVKTGDVLACAAWIEQQVKDAFFTPRADLTMAEVADTVESAIKEWEAKGIIAYQQPVRIDFTITV